jgi:hypothetical protein
MRRLTLLFAAVAAAAMTAPAVAQAPPVTLTIGKPAGGPHGTVTTVRYGEVVEVSGDIMDNRAGETVEVTIAPYRGEPTTRRIVTGTDGEFTFTDRPTIRTSYAARWRGIASEQEPLAHVAPTLGLRVRNARLGRFQVTIQARPEHASRVVWFQRRVTASRWQTVKKVRLPGNRLSVRFTARLPRGVHRVRASVPQTPGYLRGTSAFVRVRGFSR